MPTLPHPLVFQPFRQLFPFFLDSLPFPWQFFPSFCHYFDHLVCLPHTSLPTYTPINSFTGFPALQSILCLLPTLTFPPLANLSNSLAHFFSLFIQPFFFNIFFKSIFWPLFQRCGLVPSYVSTKFYAHCLSHWFSSHLANFPLFPLFTSLPLRIFHIVGYIFSANFSAIWLVSLTHLS